MNHVMKVTGVRVLELATTFPSIPNLYVMATGEVPTTGWSNIRLLPRYYAVPPMNGIWEFDFVGTPAGVAAQVVMPVVASFWGHAPTWLKRVKVVDDKNGEVFGTPEQHVAEELDLAGAHFKMLGDQVIVQKKIAVYDDSFQPIGLCGGFHVKMKKLRHELTLTVTGPDEGQIRHCIDQSLGAGAIAAIIAAFASGGMGAAGAFVSAAIATLKSCLGSKFDVRFDDQSHWIEWCT